MVHGLTPLFYPRREAAGAAVFLVPLSGDSFTSTSGFFLREMVDECIDALVIVVQMEGKTDEPIALAGEDASSCVEIIREFSAVDIRMAESHYARALITGPVAPHLVSLFAESLHSIVL